MLLDKGHEIAVIAPAGSMSASRSKIDRLDVYGLPSFSVWVYPGIRLPFPMFQKSRIRKIIEKFKPDIIHIQDHFLLCKTVVRLNRKWKIPIVATNHFMPENLTTFLRGKKWKEHLENFLWKDFSGVFNQVKMVTTPTQTGVNIIRRKLQVETLAISSGINLGKFNPAHDTHSIRAKYAIPDKPVLLYVGRLDPEKNVEEILESAAIALKKIDFCLVIVGKGIRRNALEQLAKQLGISNNVIFTGFVPDADLPHIYRLSRCFIIASTAELLSLVTLQAMASGLPVIAVNAGALNELVRHELNGYLYSQGDLSSMVRYISNIITQDELYEKMSKRSLEYARQHDINKTVESFEKLYEVVTADGDPINFQGLN